VAVVVSVLRAAMEVYDTGSGCLSSPVVAAEFVRR
jgi:hypothetical protein